MPADRLDQAVDVLQELPGEPALADAGRADDRDEAGPPLAGRRVEEVLEQAQLVVAADERRLERLASGSAPPRSATTRSARHAGTGRALPLSDLLAGRLEGDRLRGRALGRLADEDASRAARPTGGGWRC